MELALTLDNQELIRLEGVIQQNIGAFYEVGRALAKIRDRSLYKLKNGGTYQTFEGYCRGEWDMSARHAERLMSSSCTVENIRPIGRMLPLTESQARPLSRLEPEKQREVWREVVETAPEGKITAAHVSKIVRRAIGESIESHVERTRSNIQRIRKEDIVSEDFKAAYEAFYRQVQSAKLDKWEGTSREACLQMLKWINDLIAT